MDIDRVIRCGLARAWTWALVLVCVTPPGPAFAQPTAPPPPPAVQADAAERDRLEQRRADEREHSQREALRRGADVLGDADAPPSARPWPERETPCFPIERVRLQGDAAEAFGWVLHTLTQGPDAAVGRCLGPEGVSVAAARAQVSIDGAGLDVREADHAAVLARSVQLNAGLWARRLNVVVGASTVDAARHTPTGPATPTGATPAFALDVAQLGGMYAGHIHLVGTEAGLGVNSRGVIAAETGQLTLDTQGQLVNQGVLLAAGDMALHAAQLANDAGAATPATPTVAPAVIAAGGALTLRADTLDNRHGALIHSKGDMHIAGSTAGPARAVNNLSATIEAQGNLVLSTQALRNERSGVDVTQVGVLDQTARLAMPAWWVNGRNEHGAPIAATSNHAPYHYYLLNPVSILSEQGEDRPRLPQRQRAERHRCGCWWLRHPRQRQHRPARSGHHQQRRAGQEPPEHRHPHPQRPHQHPAHPGRQRVHQHRLFDWPPAVVRTVSMHWGN